MTANERPTRGLLYTNNLRLYPGHGSSDVLDDASTASPPFATVGTPRDTVMNYSANCMLSPQRMHQEHVKPGDPVLVIFARASTTLPRSLSPPLLPVTSASSSSSLSSSLSSLTTTVGSDEPVVACCLCYAWPYRQAIGASVLPTSANKSTSSCIAFDTRVMIPLDHESLVSMKALTSAIEDFKQRWREEEQHHQRQAADASEAFMNNSKEHTLNAPLPPPPSRGAQQQYQQRGIMFGNESMGTQAYDRGDVTSDGWWALPLPVMPYIMQSSLASVYTVSRGGKSSIEVNPIVVPQSVIVEASLDHHHIYHQQKQKQQQHKSDGARSNIAIRGAIQRDAGHYTCLTSPHVTAMIKRAIRQLPVIPGAVIAVKGYGSSEFITVKVVQCAPSVVSVIGIDTFITVEAASAATIRASASLLPPSLLRDETTESQVPNSKGAITSPSTHSLTEDQLGKKESSRSGTSGVGMGGMSAEKIEKGKATVRRRPRSSPLPGTSEAVTQSILSLILNQFLPIEGLDVSRYIPRGVLLTGPPGVGKTYAVQQVVERASALGVNLKLTVTSGSDLLAYGYGEAEAELRRIFTEARDFTLKVSVHMPTSPSLILSKSTSTSSATSTSCTSTNRRCSVIFMDEIDALLSKREEKGGDGSHARIVAQVLTLMDGMEGVHTSGGHVLVIGATNRPESLDSALRRPGRFDRDMALLPPGAEERADILKKHCSGFKVVGGDACLQAIAAEAVGYVGADLAALAREASLLASEEIDSSITNSGGTTVTVSDDVVGLNDGDYDEGSAGTLPVSDRHFRKAMEKVGASSLRGFQISIPTVRWDDIGGMEEAKGKLKQAVEWPLTHKEAFLRFGLSPPRGILLYGPPGCSKTTLVKAVANASMVAFVALSGADIYSPFLGEAEASVRRAFKVARGAAPAILFFDEIDALVSNRNEDSSGSAESSVLSTFLNEMDGVDAKRGDGVIVIGATNRPASIDSALLRKGRFDQLVYVPPPDKEARLQILGVHTRSIPLADDVSLSWLATRSEGLSGAELEGVCREAAMLALRRDGIACKQVRQTHFEAALGDVRPIITEEMIQQCLYFGSGKAAAPGQG